MLTVQEATNIILQHKITLNTAPWESQWEGVPLMQSIGRILAEDLVADRNFPPFDRVTMDGIAIRFQDFKNGARVFIISVHTCDCGLGPGSSPRTRFLHCT